MNTDTIATPSLLYHLWGKTNERDRKKDEASWKWRMHPAVCHMIDVGYVAETWLRLNPRLLDRFARFAPEIDRDLLGRIITAVIALHDLGKLHRSFQSKSENGWNAGYGHTDLLHDGQCRGFDHGLATGVIMRKLVKKELKGWSKWKQAFDVAAGHHGKLYLIEDLSERTTSVSSFYEELPLLLETVRVFSRLFDLPEQLPPAPEEGAFYMLLAGFTAACDWLGSDSTTYRYFNFDEFNLDTEGDLADYLNRLRKEEVADDQLRQAGLLPGVQRADYTYQDLFSILKKFPLRPLQRVSQDIPFGNDPGSEVVIVEAPMGMGKTEIALYLAARAIGVGHADGLYFALPTQASSNALFGRISEFAGTITDPGSQLSLVLAHGGSRYDKRYQTMRRETYMKRLQEAASTIGTYRDEAAPPSELIVTDWLQSSKQALLGSIGVGTIDQVLLGSIRVKHAFVRLFALANKVVVFDEIHAYDIYMNRLIRHLLTWLNALGVKVVMLSATLPKGLRDSLMEPFRSDGTSSEESDTLPEEDPYPQIIHCKDGTVSPPYTIPAELDTDEGKTIRIRREEALNDQRTQVGVRRALELADRGGCIAWIRNTVREAVEAREMLEQELRSSGGEDVELRLIHSRYIRPDRNAIEESLVEELGPPAEGRNRPKKMIVIATQVIEQSVDIDFDAMITDLAPVDLLLQRLGRMWRHRRDPAERQGHTEPVLLVLTPTAEEIHEMQMGSSAYVYDHEILTRTAILVRDYPEWRMPIDCRRLVALLYDHEEDWTAERQGVDPDRLATIRRRRTDEDASSEHKARLTLMPGPDQRLEMETARKEDDEGEFVLLTTRLGGAGGTVVLLRRTAKELVFLGKPDLNASEIPEREDYRGIMEFDEGVMLSSVSFPWWDPLEVPVYEDPDMTALNAWWRERKPFDNKIFLLLDAEGKAEHPQFTATYRRHPDGTPAEGLVIEKTRTITEEEVDYTHV